MDAERRGEYMWTRILLIVAATVFGLGLGIFLVSDEKDVPESTIQQNWDILKRYNAEMKDVKNIREIDGMLGVDTEIDPLPALAALTSAGEIEHVDLVFPNVPNNRDTNGRWIKFVDSHDDILYAEGNTTYVDFKPTGDQPLHLNIWFRDSATPKIQDLIRRLESLTAR